MHIWCISQLSYRKTHQEAEVVLPDKRVEWYLSLTAEIICIIKYNELYAKPKSVYLVAFRARCYSVRLLFCKQTAVIIPGGQVHKRLTLCLH